MKRQVRTRRASNIGRRRRRHVINYRRLFLGIVFPVLAVVLVYALLTTPYLNITERKVFGAKTISSNKILAELPFGTNILLLNKRPVVARILASNPEVKEVRLYRKLPNSLLARIVERKAAFTLDTGQGLYEMDSTGVPFRLIGTAVPGIPVICYAPPQSPVLGTRIRTPGLKGALESSKIACREGLLGIGKITVDQNNDLCLNVRDKYEVRLGQPEQLLEKIKTAVHTERKPGVRDTLEYIDVTCPDAPAYKPRGGDRSSVK